MSGSIDNSLEIFFWMSLFAAPLGAFLIFRRLSFLGDAVGHSSLAGLACVFLLGWTHPVLLMGGVLLTVFLMSFLFRFLEKSCLLPSDVALTVSYIGLFALGLLLMSRTGVDLEHVLFGHFEAIDDHTLWFLRLWALMVLFLMIFLWKPLWATVIDSRFAHSLGYQTSKIDFLLLILISVSLVGMIRAVGIVLVAAYFVFPAVTVLPWVRSLKSLVIASSSVAFVISCLAFFISVKNGLEHGPMITLIGFFILLLSHCFKLILQRRLS